jgi:retron-type reverse transcriptase
MATSGTERSGASGLMERVLARPNLLAALKRVRKNKGSPGIDGMTVEALPEWLREHWPRIREELFAGAYQPQPIKRQLIPKTGGGERALGIPTVLDRLIQQAVLQVLQPRFDPTFSEHNHGFRPGRRAHDAVREAQRYVQAGRRWVVVERHEGTPQGGPLSPLLANVLLDVVDKELEKRGHAFSRYADDCNVYVRSERAGQRVMRLLRRLYARLRLQVNEEKSAVASVFTRQFLGFSLWVAKGRVVKRKVSRKALEVMKRRVRWLTRRNRGRSLAQVVERLRAYLVGWKAYFRLADTPGVFRQLDEWLRHRLRAIQLKHWRRGRTIYRELRARGMSHETARLIAANSRRWWRNSRYLLNAALPIRFFDELGLPRFAA